MTGIPGESDDISSRIAGLFEQPHAHVPAVSGITFEISGFEIGMVEQVASARRIGVEQVFVEGAREVVGSFDVHGVVPRSTFYEELGYFTDI